MIKMLLPVMVVVVVMSIVLFIETAIDCWDHKQSWLCGWSLWCW